MTIKYRCRISHSIIESNTLADLAIQFVQYLNPKRVYNEIPTETKYSFLRKQEFHHKDETSFMDEGEKWVMTKMGLKSTVQYLRRICEKLEIEFEWLEPDEDSAIANEIVDAHLNDIQVKTITLSTHLSNQTKDSKMKNAYDTLIIQLNEEIARAKSQLENSINDDSFTGAQYDELKLVINSLKQEVITITQSRVNVLGE